MSLKQFHILFINLAILMLVGFFAWTLSPQGKTLGSQTALWGVVCLLLAIGLIVYEISFFKKTKGLLIALALIGQLVGVKSSQACTMCFSQGAGNSQLIAVKLGILSLFLILMGVLATLVWFFIGMAKKSKSLSVNSANLT